MRTKVLTIDPIYEDSDPITLRIEYPNSVAFMYSRQPVRLAFESGAEDVSSVEVQVWQVRSGQTYTEARRLRLNSVEFDISRIMQLLGDGVDSLTQRANADSFSFAEEFVFIVYLQTVKSRVQVLADMMVGMYGALDQGETYGEHTQRRLWVNFPQTFNLWTDSNGRKAFVIGSDYINPTIAATQESAPCHECDLMSALESEEKDDLIDALRNGMPLKNIGLTWTSRIQDGEETESQRRTITLIPELCKPADGTYLRWLNRRGELSYWLFTNSKLRVTTAQADSFTRYYEGDPTVPIGKVYRNPQKASYREAREMVLGAVGLSLDEFEDLCDLATSPIVERLMPPASGGMSDLAIVVKWQRVNVVAGTFERGIRRSTPSRQDMEIIIELPERNTIQL